MGPAPPTTATSPGFDVAAADGVIGHREGFDEGGFVQRDVADGVDPPGVDDDRLAQAPAAARQADEAQFGAQVVVTAEARAAFVADNIGFHHHAVPDGEPGHSLAQFLDSAGKFVPQGHRGGLMGKHVGAVRAAG